MLKGSGLSIRDMRSRLSMTQEEFAHALGITVSTVNRWENGKREISRMAENFCKALEAQRTTI